ncbi:hypothetical protein [Aurantimonas sp. VKM B-3413]|uniref:hypothetical protein n=1 Tax=Aurantimonas sp. VKM B-3413 TaxID=2779401 RepID=UPI001E4DEDE3|nr:hypothetical protein [Aurantimonas sp. VKM B-3413]MCB8839338.1 hypothetical protein [Aurantimonas sp. VKM B-3413]
MSGRTSATRATIATLTIEIDEATAASLDQLSEQKRHADRAGLLGQIIAEYAQRETEPEGYDAWFREEVETALREMDDPGAEFIPGEDVSRAWEEQRAALLKRATRKTG